MALAAIGNEQNEKNSLSVAVLNANLHIEKFSFVVGSFVQLN